MELATLENRKIGVLYFSCGEREKVGDTPAVSSVEVKGKRVGGRGKGRRSCFYLWGRYSRKRRLAKGGKGENETLLLHCSPFSNHFLPGSHFYEIFFA